MSNAWLQKLTRQLIRRKRSWHSLVRTYRALSSASVDDLWRKVVDLADVSWNPLLSSTNLPNGLVPKPGLIYQAVTRFIPIPVQVFVERVRPGELLSVRILLLPGVEEQVSYQVSSTVLGTCISCSITLRGALSPLFWSLIRSQAARLAAELAKAAEQPPLNPGIAKDSVFDC